MRVVDYFHIKKQIQMTEKENTAIKQILLILSRIGYFCFILGLGSILVGTEGSFLNPSPDDTASGLVGGSIFCGAISYYLFKYSLDNTKSKITEYIILSLSVICAIALC